MACLSAIIPWHGDIDYRTSVLGVVNLTTYQTNCILTRTFGYKSARLCGQWKFGVLDDPTKLQLLSNVRGLFRFSTVSEIGNEFRSTKVVVDMVHCKQM